MERGCAILRCVRRQGYYCCADCRERDVCKRVCHNDPERCGMVRDRASRKKEDKEGKEGKYGPGT